MAGKPSKKSRKTTTSKDEGAQQVSAVTSISRATPSTDRHPRGAQQVDLEIEEQIRVRAYELFEQRGRHEGFDREDWERAKAEVLARYQREKSA
jgi:hypothetical protein